MANVKKKCKVVILPSEKYSPLVLSTSQYGGLFKSEHYSPMKEMGDSYQHLYITSDEQIKEGDWCVQLTLSGDAKNLVKVSSSETSKMRKKIIATTDSSLTKIKVNKNIYERGEDDIIQLPQPSPQFIQAYIEAYNAGNPIVDVMVEYGTFIPDWELDMITPTRREVLKVDKNNYITITKCKESWSREELLSILDIIEEEVNSDGFFNKNAFIKDNL